MCDFRVVDLAISSRLVDVAILLWSRYFIASVLGSTPLRLSVVASILWFMDGGSVAVVGHPVVAALDAVSEALDHAAAADVWSLSDDDLQATIVACEALAARQAAVSLRLVREADGRDLGRRLGASSTTAWLKDRLRLRPGEAKTRVDLAHRLDPHAADGPLDFAANVSTLAGHRSMPATAAALARGEVSADHAQVIAKIMVGLPGGISTEQERVAEMEVAGWAQAYDPVTVARLGRHLIHALDTDTLADREQRAHRRRDLRWIDTGEGTTRISGQLDTESAAIVRAALDSLAAPDPAADGSQDPRTAGQRMADALVELARRSCQTGDLPAGHGVRPHLAVIVSLDTLQHKAAEAGCGWTPTAPGELGWGGPISAEAVRRIACDAGITRVVTDPAGVPLDVGRESRTVTAGQWAALVARDRGCAFPGVHKAPRMVSRPPRQALGRRGTYRPGQSRRSLRASPPSHPPRRLAHPHNRRPVPRIHPASLDRPGSNPPPKHQTQIRTQRPVWAIALGMSNPLGQTFRALGRSRGEYRLPIFARGEAPCRLREPAKPWYFRWYVSDSTLGYVKAVIDLKHEALALAAKELGSSTKKATVNAALEFVANRRRRIEQLLGDPFALGVGLDITDREVMGRQHIATTTGQPHSWIVRRGTID